jgi:hypothetical protein
MGWQQFAIQAGLQLGQYALDKRAQQKAFEQNKQFWHERFDKEAKYNSPVQQKARMMQAGLNPALMYKGGQTGGQTTGGSAQGKIAEKAQLAELAQMSAQVKNIQADTQRKKAETFWIQDKATGQQTNNKIALQNLVVAELNALNAPKDWENRIKNGLMDWLSKVAEVGQKEAQTEYWKGKAQEINNINYEWLKLEKELIDKGVDRNSPLFQSLKTYMAVNGARLWDGAKKTWNWLKEPNFEGILKL